MRIAVLTDVHANLLALEAALQSIDKRGCDLIVHTGDLIGIGPFPKECCDILMSRLDTKFIMGNHDAWFAFGIPNPTPSYMSMGEVNHHNWVHAQLDDSLKEIIAKWPYEISESFEGISIDFVHYGLTESRDDFVSLNANPSAKYLDMIFSERNSDIVFYGHDHIESDLQGRCRYLNRGALGCYKLPVARYAIVDMQHSAKFTIENYSIEYDDTPLFKELESRKVPEREFIKKVFFLR